MALLRTGLPCAGLNPWQDSNLCTRLRRRTVPKRFRRSDGYLGNRQAGSPAYVPRLRKIPLSPVSGWRRICQCGENVRGGGERRSLSGGEAGGADWSRSVASRPRPLRAPRPPEGIGHVAMPGNADGAGLVGVCRYSPGQSAVRPRAANPGRIAGPRSGARQGVDTRSIVLIAFPVALVWVKVGDR